MAQSQRKGRPVKFNTAEGHRKRTKNGKTFKFLDPDQKGRRFAKELKEGCNLYTGEKLSKSQRAWRAGQLAARKDSANCYKAKKKKRQAKK